MLVDIDSILGQGKVFYGYYRLSKQEQASQGAKDSHEFALMCAFEGAGIPFDPSLIRFDIMSGRRNDRKQLQWLFGEVVAGRCGGLVTRLDRLSRNAELFHEIERIFSGNGALIYSLLDSRWIDFSNTDQWHKYYTDGLNAELESRKIGERIKLRNRHNRHKGKPHSGGPVPIGLKRNADGSYARNDAHAEIVALIKSQFIEDHATTNLPPLLLSRFGIKTTSTGLTKWLKSPLLRGHIVHGWQSGRDYGQPPILNAHDAIITPAEASLIDSILTANKGRRGRNAGNKIYPLAKLMTCGRCGGKACIALGGREPNKKAYVICHQYRYGFGCLDWVKKKNGKGASPGSRQNIYDRVEASVILALQARARDVAARANDFESQGAVNQETPEISRLKAEVAQAELQAIVDPDYAPVLAAKKKRLDAALVAVAPRRIDDIEAILAGIESDAAWVLMPPVVRRHLYEELVETVLVWPDRTEVRLQF
jgi:DNA invertase Pin-like site-specific DNA recombinase